MLDFIYSPGYHWLRQILHYSLDLTVLVLVFCLGMGFFFVVVVFCFFVFCFFFVNHTDFMMMQIEMETQILSDARHALISTRECQAILNLGDYLCCFLNASSAALACVAAQQSHQGRDTSLVSL